MTVKEIPTGIEVIPGWELVRIGCPVVGEFVISPVDGVPTLVDFVTHSQGLPIIRKIEKPKRYRAFANGAEYIAYNGAAYAADYKSNSDVSGFYAIISANDWSVWVAFGAEIQRFTWAEAFERLVLRDRQGNAFPFGIEVTE